MPAVGTASSAAPRRSRASGATTVSLFSRRTRSAPAAKAAWAPSLSPPANCRFTSRATRRTPDRAATACPRRRRSAADDALSTTMISVGGTRCARSESTQRSVVAPPSHVTTTAGAGRGPPRAGLAGPGPLAQRGPAAGDGRPAGGGRLVPLVRPPPRGLAPAAEDPGDARGRRRLVGQRGERDGLPPRDGHVRGG